jgi:hypothetical protein
VGLERQGDWRERYMQGWEKELVRQRGEERATRRAEQEQVQAKV